MAENADYILCNTTLNSYSNADDRIGKNDFLEPHHRGKTNTSSLEYYDVSSIEGYLIESLSEVEILEKQWRFEFSKLCLKDASCHGNIHVG